MSLAFLQHAYDQPGPFASLYLNVSGDAEDAAKAVQLRWRSARAELQRQGADEATLQAMDAIVGSRRWQPGQREQVVIANRDGVVLTDELPATPGFADYIVHFGPLPHLLPYLWKRGPRVPHVSAVVDHVGADIAVIDTGAEVVTMRVEGEDFPVHKSYSAGEGSIQRHHNAVEEQWRRNAATVADELTKRVTSIGAQAVLLAGDVQQRTLVRDELPKDLRNLVVDSVDEVVRDRASHIIADFERERGERDRAVEGWQSTVDALRRGQVDTLLRTTPVDGGDQPTVYIGQSRNELAFRKEELTAMGVRHVDSAPADDAVLRALVGSDADLMFVDPDAVKLADGIGALLRYRDATTP